MEKQYNSDLDVAKQERLSNSLVGQLLLAGVPHLNLLFEDELGISAVHFFKEKYIIHSEIYAEPTLEVMKEAKKRSLLVDKIFKDKGIKEIYTWAEAPEQHRFNKYLGYIPTNVIVNDTFVEKDYPYEVHEYRKELI